MKDYIGIIIVLIFIVGPLIKKIFEALAGGQGQPQRRASVQEVKDYLDKMRQGGQQQAPIQRKYKAPATYSPTYGQKKYDPLSPHGGRKQYGRKERSSQLQQLQQKKADAIVEEVFALEDSQRKSLRVAPVASVEKAIPVVPVPQEKTGEGSVFQRLMQEPRYSDAQKALVFSEIFKRPKVLKRIFQE